MIGGAEAALDEFRQATDLCGAVAQSYVTLVVNDVITQFPHAIDHAVTLHPERYPEWLKLRRSRGYPDPTTVWAHRHHRHRKDLVNRLSPDWGGSVGLLAAKIAILELKHTKVILCGVPMTLHGGHILRKQPWRAVINFTAAWQKHRAELAPCVRSWSGWTAELFGKPDQQWSQSER